MRHRLNIENMRQRLQTPTFKPYVFVAQPTKVHNGQYAAFGWDREHIQLLEQMAEKGAEPIRSLGHDAPLAAIDPERKNIADFIKESVAVVTNPAIDRDRETEHFSTRVVVGKRPSIVSHEEHPYTVELLSPILIEGKLGNECAETLQQPSYDQLVHAFKEKQLAYFISATFVEHETIPMALNRLGKEACEAVANGKTLLIIDLSLIHI